MLNVSSCKLKSYSPSIRTARRELRPQALQRGSIMGTAGILGTSQSSRSLGYTRGYRLLLQPAP